MLIVVGDQAHGGRRKHAPRAEPMGKTATLPGKEILRLSGAIGCIFLRGVGGVRQIEARQNIESIVRLDQPSEHDAHSCVRPKGGWLSDLVAQAYYERPGNSAALARVRDHRLRPSRR
jgi:hypothetical protein